MLNRKSLAFARSEEQNFIPKQIKGYQLFYNRGMFIMP